MKPEKSAPVSVHDSQTENTPWQSAPLVRANTRAVLLPNVGEDCLTAAVEACVQRVRAAQAAHQVLVAALYRYGRMLFFYCEGIGAAQDPGTLLAPLAPLLQPWPPLVQAQQAPPRLWAQMAPVLCQARPANAGDWLCPAPQRRRGRIAVLAPGKWESYVYHHLALTREGLLLGDRYQFIAVHEDVLFSYFEEPRHNVTLSKRDAPSAVLDQWLALDPQSHFARFAPGQGPGPDQNFVFLPTLFAFAPGETDTKEPNR